MTQSETSDVVEVPEVKTPGRKVSYSRFIKEFCIFKGRPSKKNSIQESDDSTVSAFLK